MSATARSATSILGVALGLSVSVSCNADGGTVKKEDANSKATADPEVYEGQLRLVREIVLEEPDSAPLGAIASFGSLHDSLFVVVDQMSSRVRVYGKAGKLLSSFGRAGGGPGEFLQIQAGAFDQLGRVHTVETGSRRLTRFSTTGQLQLVTQMAPGTQIVSGPDSILALVRAADPGAPAVAVITSSHRVVTQVMPIDTVYSTVPYWNALLRAYIALAPNTLFGATSLVYRIHSYDLQTGTTKQPFGTPPKSWRETPRPERSQFAGASARTALAAWLNELTVLAGLYALNDSMLVVAHGRFAAQTTKPMHEFFKVHHYAIDIYSPAGEKIAEDLPSQQVLAGGRYLYVLHASPPEPWTIGVYELR